MGGRPSGVVTSPSESAVRTTMRLRARPRSPRTPPNGSWRGDGRAAQDRASAERSARRVGILSCRRSRAPTIDEARDLVRDALDEWLAALASEERASIGPDNSRETLTLSVA